MEWNQAIVEKLTSAFSEKYKDMFGVPTIDRKNRSALWNKYLKNYDCRLIRNDVPGKKGSVRSQEIVCKNLIALINFKNEEVANALVINNPDRFGQFLLIPKDIAERILVFGMI
jgi:hypothetical protein